MTRLTPTLIGRGVMTMCDRSHLSEQAIDSRARRAARRVGLIARKSRWRVGTIVSRAGFRPALLPA
jgi:hypothetical protein